MKFKKFFILWFFTNFSTSFCFIELFSSTAVGFGSYVYNSLLLGNACSDREIPANYDVLKNSLQRNLFGQPLVEKTVVSALKSHWDVNHKASKALTMSFHGGPGVGKNYVSKFIADALFNEEGRKQNVHSFTARIHFPEEKLSHVYKNNLREWIKGNVTKCPKQLFIFDEVNSMPPGVLDAIKPFIDYNVDINGVSSREAIFIFLSNTGTNVLNQHVYDLWKAGKKRDNLKLQDFERIISKGAFNEKGGFQGSVTISSNLIDHYIPFLPLMEPHVILCIKHEFAKRGHKPNEREIKDVLETIDFGPESVEIFAKTGCKRISQKVALLTH